MDKVKGSTSFGFTQSRDAIAEIASPPATKTLIKNPISCNKLTFKGVWRLCNSQNQEQQDKSHQKKENLHPRLFQRKSCLQGVQEIQQDNQGYEWQAFNVTKGTVEEINKVFKA